MGNQRDWHRERGAGTDNNSGAAVDFSWKLNGSGQLVGRFDSTKGNLLKVGMASVLRSVLWARQ
jgi:hypothetical protein